MPEPETPETSPDQPKPRRNLARHPVVHIAVLGVLLGVILLIAVGPPEAEEASRRVVVTGGDLVQLRAAFMRTWQREPTQTELRGELEKFIREEVLYREALARGYDRDDLVVRRAMQRKMEFLADSQLQGQTPSDEEIEAYFALRGERYRTPAQVSFAQVFFSTDRRGERAEGDAQEALGRLRQADPSLEELAEWGDPLMLGISFSGQREQEIRARFGDEFTTALLALEPGDWEGPIASGYGLHLARVTRRIDSRIPAWTEVRDRVLSDMSYEARNATRDQVFQEIAQRYQVILGPQVQQLLDTGAE